MDKVEFVYDWDSEANGDWTYARWRNGVIALKNKINEFSSNSIICSSDAASMMNLEGSLKLNDDDPTPDKDDLVYIGKFKYIDNFLQTFIDPSLNGVKIYLTNME